MNCRVRQRRKQPLPARSAPLTAFLHAKECLRPPLSGFSCTSRMHQFSDQVLTNGKLCIYQFLVITQRPPTHIAQVALLSNRGIYTRGCCVCPFHLFPRSQQWRCTGPWRTQLQASDSSRRRNSKTANRSTTICGWVLRSILELTT
jgi:hypothetical protein